MTEPLYEPLHEVEQPSGGGLAGSFGPEALAAVLSIVVVVALLASRLAFAGGGVATPSPGASESPRPATTPNPNARLQVVIGTLLQIDDILSGKRDELAIELKQNPFNVQDVKTTMNQIYQQMPTAIALSGELAATPQGGVIGAELGAVYHELQNVAGAAIQISPTSEAKYKSNAERLIGILDRLPPLDERLRAMAGGLPDPNGSAPPSGPPSVIPSESPSDSLPPSPSVAPTATIPPPTPTIPPPTAPPPSFPSSIPPATPAPGPNALQNPGFEAGVGPPWQLLLNGPALATISADNQQHNGGTMSARIDITVPSPSRNWISLQQGGLEIIAGATYHVSIAAKSAAPRQIRVRIATPTGQTLGNGSMVLSIGPAWQVQSFDMSSIVPSTNAVVAIDMGGTGETVWLDDVSVARIPPGTP
jgi:hypothetical protein